VRRRLFKLAAAVSLVLCVATVALWVTSYWFNFTAVKGTVTGHAGPVPVNDWYSKQLSLGWGSIDLMSTATINDDPASSRYQGLHFYRTRIRPNDPKPQIGYGGENWLGFAIWESTGAKFNGSVQLKSFAQRHTTVNLPFWFPLIVSAVLPAVWARTHLQRRKLAQMGCCKVCGYDLRATPERCPECGAAGVSGRSM
jgi:hypothetical protein